MIFASFIDQILTDKKTVDDHELTAAAEEQTKKAKAAASGEPGLMALPFLALACKHRASDIQIECKDRQLTLRFESGYLNDGFWSSPDLLDWWWLLLAEVSSNAWLAYTSSGQMQLLGWAKGKVFRSASACPVDGGVVEFQAVLKQLASPVLNAMADKKMIDQIREILAQRARLYPMPIYANGVAASSPLDIKIRQVSSFSSYDLIEDQEQDLGFAAAHPWAHGCRYWLTPDGRIIDLHSKGANDIDAKSGNICQMTALGNELSFERRLNILRKSGQDCIELSPVRNMWGKTSYLPEMGRYLLDSRPLVFGENPVVKLMAKPLRVRQLLIQTEQTQEANHIIPIRNGLALDTVFENSKPGGLVIYSIPPQHLTTTLNGRRLATSAALAEWTSALAAEARERQKPLSE
jgi:hypothetical protein